ncbi:vWA domain-containing protein [Sorangium sp. So ce1036]|uniref:vWA domain-containing protein n=1 Tax=Sorangium sp. So ce1036 TaxID=3133328 RepID=UPI003F0BCFF2
MSFRRHFVFAPFLIAAGLAPISGGCAATGDRGPAGTSTPDDAGSGGGGGVSGGGFGSGDITGGASLAEGGLGAAGAGEGELSDDASCAQTSAQATLLPLDMLILLDRSGSMLGSKWSGVTSAISRFVNDTASAGMNVGLTYFPRGAAGQNDCEHTSYEALAVPFGELPTNTSALTASIQDTSPSGGTPMRPALQGVLANATAYQDANPSHKVIVVLATDGDPSGCASNTVANTAELAQRALNYNGVQTYVIAVEGSTVSNLDQIAAAGGTTRAFDVTADVSAFSAKMAEIRASALPCELLVPEPPLGAILDQSRVAVRLASGSSGELEIPRADDQADCGAGPGWYYDNEALPKKIILCPASCTTVQATAHAKLDVLFGCEPKLN